MKDDYAKGQCRNWSRKSPRHTASYDLHEKLNGLSCSGVREYIVCRTLDRRNLIILTLSAGQQYRPITPDARGDSSQQDLSRACGRDAAALLADDVLAALKHCHAASKESALLNTPRLSEVIKAKANR